MTSNSLINVSVICEGKTELFFVKTVLSPYFIMQNINLLPIDMGGNVSIDKTVKYVNRTTPGIVTTFLDYYGFKKATGKTSEEIMNEINSRSNREHTIPYLQMHEIEALWFSDIDKIALKMNAGQHQKTELQNIINEFDNPEEINNSYETAPSKRLEKIFKGYDKPRDGQIIAKEIGVLAIMEKCPRFKYWINDITTTATQLRGN